MCIRDRRYITQELKDLEHEILTASERAVALEYQLFTALREKIVAQAPRIQRTAAAVAEIDALGSLANVAVRDGYCRPDVDESGVIEITAGRHPVVERVLKDSLFVPNDTFMGENCLLYTSSGRIQSRRSGFRRRDGRAGPLGRHPA